jgi:hypothetical protein
MEDQWKVVEMPFKYSFKVAIIFAVSSFLLGYAYEFMALSALGASETNANWPEIRGLGGFSLDRAVRYFIFFFISFLTLQCLRTQPGRPWAWRPLALLAICPALMSFIPYLFSGSFNASMHWALVSLLIGLMCLGIGPNSNLRLFFYVILMVILASDVLTDLSTWGAEFHKAAVILVGEQRADGKTWGSLFYFAPVAIVNIAVQVYLIYRVPREYLSSTTDEDGRTV